MTVAGLELRRLGEAADTLARAFAEDPASLSLWPDPRGMTAPATSRPTPSATRLYERHGFEVIEAAARLLPDGPTHWRMLRPAQT